MHPENHSHKHTQCMDMHRIWRQLQVDKPAGVS